MRTLAGIFKTGISLLAIGGGSLVCLRAVGAGFGYSGVPDGSDVNA